jgi:hypothetical protein
MYFMSFRYRVLSTPVSGGSSSGKPMAATHLRFGGLA